jgi:hypothetical protein
VSAKRTAKAQRGRKEDEWQDLEEAECGGEIARSATKRVSSVDYAANDRMRI